MSFSESDQMFAEFDFRTTQMTERPLWVPEEIRQRPEALVVPVFMPSQYETRLRSLLVFSMRRVRPLLYLKLYAFVAK